MPEKKVTSQRLQTQQNLPLRRPPKAGGPRRAPLHVPARRRPKSLLRKALPYLISGGSIGGSILGTLGLSNLFSS